jgi:hypothetical protein
MKQYKLGSVFVLLFSFAGCQTEDVQPLPGSFESKVVLSASKLAISEDAGALELTATLSLETSSDVVVSLSYAGPAISGQDYNAANSITIGAGSLSASITLDAINDTEEEGIEQITVSISTIAGSATEDGEQSVSINLEDDDVEATVQLLLNEILYDPSNSGLDGDANGDGSYAQSEDEFVEIINMSSQSIDISGFKIFDTESLGATANHTFPSGTVLASGKAIVVFGGGTPTGSFGGATVQISSSGDLNLNNAGDELILQDEDGQELLRFDIEPLSNNPNESYTRNPDLTGDFEQHSANNATLYSPGTKGDGTSF